MNVRTVIIDRTPHALPLSDKPLRIEPSTGIAFTMEAGEELRVIDPTGEQVAMLAASMAHDTQEWFSGRSTIAQAGKLYMGEGDVLLSSRSAPMFTIIEDTVERHDLLLPPYPSSTAEDAEDADSAPTSCVGVLADNLRSFNANSHAILSTFNLFMNVHADPSTHELSVGLSRSMPGDHVVLRAENNLVVGLAACSCDASDRRPVTPIDVILRAAE